MVVRILNILIVIICLNKNTEAQNPTKEYFKLTNKADSLYKAKDYKKSALAYSLAFNANKGKGSLDDRYKAACSWARAGVSDSAFANLFKVANYGNYINQNYNLQGDRDLLSLHKDARWNSLIELAKQNKIKTESYSPLIKKLDSIYYDDQINRQKMEQTKKKYGSSSKQVKELWKIINEKDSINLLKVTAIIDQHGWLGPEFIGQRANTTLFLVIQHSDQKTQEKYLPIMREAALNGRAEPSALALLEDRVALGQGKKQIYGSQIITDNKTGKDIIAPIEDESNVNIRRAKVGLPPLEVYAKLFGIKYKPIGNSAQKSHTNSGTGGTDTKIIQTKIPFKKQKNADAEFAIEIHDSIYGPTNVSYGHGNILEYNADNFINEGHSAWFKFSFDRDTVLTLDIVPENGKDDYDFLLFKCESTDCLPDLKKGKKAPERVCYSFNASKNSSTGLSEYAIETRVGAGAGPSYVPALKVKKGEIYYLMVDYATDYVYRGVEPKGFTIYFYNYWPKKKPIVLKDVQFNNNKSVLLKSSFEALDKLVEEMKKDKRMNIEIIGHSDNSGDEEKNVVLSEKRAMAVYDYLVSKGIKDNRILTKGVGSSKPIADNNTSEGRQKNRRVEFKIIMR